MFIRARQPYSLRRLLRSMARSALLAVGATLVVLADPPVLVAGLASLMGGAAAVYWLMATIIYLWARIAGRRVIGACARTPSRRATSQEAEEYWSQVRQPQINFAYRWPAPHPATRAPRVKGIEDEGEELEKGRLVVVVAGSTMALAILILILTLIYYVVVDVL